MLAIGCPWVQDRVNEPYQLTAGDVALTNLLGFVQWRLTPGGGTSWAWMFANDVGAVVVLAGVALVVPRLWRNGLSGGFRIAAAMGTAVLITLTAGLVNWVVAVALANLDSAIFVLTDIVTQATWFAVLLGTAFVFILPGPAGIRAGMSIARPTARRRKRGSSVDASPVAAPIGSVPGDVTRYLCAAAYTDEAFARTVVDDVLADELSAVAPSVGVDLVAVARHCIAAQDVRFRRDVKLSGAIAAVLVLGPLWLLFGVFGLKLVAAVTTGEARRPGDRGDSQEVTSASLAKGALTLAALTAIAIVAAVGLSSVSLPGLVRWFSGFYLFGIPALLALVAALLVAYRIVVGYVLDTDKLLRDTMRRPVFSSQRMPPKPRQRWLVTRLSAIEQAQSGNVTIYSGYTPFIGFAATQSNWSLAVALLPPDPFGGPRRHHDGVTDFTVVELVDYLSSALNDIAVRHETAPPTDGDARLDTLTVESRIFVNGATLADDERFLSGSQLVPSTRLSPEKVREIALSPDGTVRHYLAVHVPLWGGDVVPSVFLHFSTTGKTLHLHCDTHVLGPVNRAYHAVDRLPDRLTPDRHRWLRATAIAEAQSLLAGAPLRVLRRARAEGRHGKRFARDLRAAQQDPMFDYGARLSIRELALSSQYLNYFQVVDAARVVSAVERHALAAIREFLDAHGVDTTDFRSQQQAIFNQGVIYQGGVSIVGNQAVGKGASAVQTQGSAPATPSS